MSTGPTYALSPTRPTSTTSPTMPFAAQTIENLLAAGTCISATSAAIASTRVSGICLATGYAAGRLALSTVSTT